MAASSSNFPAVIGNGMAMTVGFLGPCGFNTPHTHPRATEFNFVVNGSIQAGFLVENGARFVFNEIPPGSAAIFPQGQLYALSHTETFSPSLQAQSILNSITHVVRINTPSEGSLFLTYVVQRTQYSWQHSTTKTRVLIRLRSAVSTICMISMHSRINLAAPISLRSTA